MTVCVTVYACPPPPLHTLLFVDVDLRSSSPLPPSLSQWFPISSSTGTLPPITSTSTATTAAAAPATTIVQVDAPQATGATLPELAKPQLKAEADMAAATEDKAEEGSSSNFVGTLTGSGKVIVEVEGKGGKKLKVKGGS